MSLAARLASLERRRPCAPPNPEDTRTLEMLLGDDEAVELAERIRAHFHGREKTREEVAAVFPELAVVVARLRAQRGET